MTAPVIVQHCYGDPGLGGPMGGLRRLLASDVARTYRFETVYQTRPANGINLGLVGQMAAAVRAFEPDLLHVRGLGNEGFHGLLAGRLARCPRILVSVHGSQGTCPFSPRQWIVSRILEPLTLRGADGVYCVSAAAASSLTVRRHARHLFRHIYNGVELPPVLPPDPGLRATLGFCSTDRIALYVGRLSVQKGLLDLCQAFAQARKSHAHLRLLIVGDGVDRAQIEAAARKATGPMPTFVGRREDVFALMRACDFVVLPSHHETLGNVLLEAMACARAVVATRVGGIPEVVVDAHTGLLVSPRNPRALADAMLRLSQNPVLCAAYGRAGRLRAETTFSLDRCAHAIGRVYDEMLQW